MKKTELKYKTPADRTIEGWEKYSLPIGNGYFGASVFGGTDIERVQFTTNVFANFFRQGGVSNFAEVYIDFNDEAQNYVRSLDLRTGIARSEYLSAYGKTKREAFLSYPDNVFVYRSTFEKRRSVRVRLEIPYLGARCVEDGGREGEVFCDGEEVVMRGKLPSRDLLFEGRIAVLTDGEKTSANGVITVENAREIVVLFVADTSYKLCHKTFATHKAEGEDPHEKVVERLESAKKLGYARLKTRHEEDFSGIMNRVELNLGGEADERTTDELLQSYREGNRESYLEELYYQYGRYLLVSSSRKGTPPASLQGVWTAHDKSPWGCGFWHNINEQMNYWHAFSTNIAETFDAYADFFKAYLPEAENNAKEWIKETNPENAGGDCGWIIGTGAFCYEVEGKNPNSHSGPGTGGLTAKLFADAYYFTRDEKFLKEYAYPAVHGMAKFLKKTLRNYDGRMLCSFSASPEQILSGDIWINQHKYQQYYHTVGCSFDQQMVKEVFEDDLELSSVLGVSDETTEFEKENINSLDAIRVGYSGQIKEYDEENFYGEIGEAKHRHLSQLVALMPGRQITDETSAYLDAARITLDKRGDKSTGWALAHRLCSRARTGEGDRAYLLLQNLLRYKTHPNLWDVHPPFQIDGNFGATAGMTEMLLQSHGGYISLLPAVPNEWKNIKFKGLKARGDYEVSLDYNDGQISVCEIKSYKGGRIAVGYGGNLDKAEVTVCGKKISAEVKDDKIVFDTVAGETYRLTGFEKCVNRTMASDFTAEWCDNGVRLKWENDGREYEIFRAEGNEPAYKKIGSSIVGEYLDTDFSASSKVRLTYKAITGGSKNGAGLGALAVLDPASELEKERYAYRIKINNMNAE